MSQIEINRYLEKISSESPCGDYLEYDADYQEMERLSKGSPEIQYGESITAAEEGDWQAVRKKALSLLERTRDIYVAVYLAMAEVRLANLSGVSQSFSLIAGLLDQFWDDVHPIKDPEDSYPILRMNVLATLNDLERFIKPIRNIPLTASTIFPLSLRAYEITIGKIEPVSADDSETKLTEDQLAASFKDSSEESLKKNLQWIEEILESIESIARVTTEKAGNAAAPNLSALTGQLKAMKKVFDKYADIQTDTSQHQSDPSGIYNENDHKTKTQNSPVNQAGSEVNNQAALHENGDANMAGITGISNREQVSEALDLICAYFEMNEPSSPIPLLLKRAQRLLDKDFLEILQDLAPDGVNQATNICGVENTEQN